MKRVQRFQTDDGKIFLDEAAAVKHEILLQAIDHAMSPLPPLSDGDRHLMTQGAAYRQHMVGSVLLARLAMIEIAKVQFASFFRSNPEWFEHSIQCSSSMLSRIIQDGDSPLNTSWFRLICIDKQGREWEQPYFVSHPPSAARAI